MIAMRLIVDPPQPGDWNMAVDEALLHAAIAGITTLRFYQWSAPTLSLGYFQEYGQREQHAASRDCAWVRRTSGGGAILHDRELTYSFATPASGRGLSAAASAYSLFHTSLIRSLSRWGLSARLCGSADRGPAAPFLCFQRRSAVDVLVGDRKVCGSAQRRHRGALLQHGSVILARSTFAPEIEGIQEVAGNRLEALDLADAWRQELERTVGVTWSHSGLSPSERVMAQGFREGRFTADRWLQRR